MRQPTAALILVTAFACLDPLYEDGTASGYFVCCQGGRVNTCACESGQTCRPDFKPCAAGGCSTTLSCGFGGADAGSAGGGNAGGGNASDAGSTSDAGVADAGVADAGVADAGVADAGVADAGVADAGVADAGSAGGGSGGGGSGGGGVFEDVFELCCAAGRVATCRCLDGLCTKMPFTACQGSRCVTGSSTASCR
jgi:hypothetical protein